MSMYWTCKYGANHDHGEACDCEKDKIEEERKRQKSFRVEKHGQLGFCFNNKEEVWR